MDELAPYSGTVCRVCGFVSAEYKFCVQDCTADARGGFDGTRAMGDPDKPHLHRTCSRCGFQWLERVKSL